MRPTPHYLLLLLSAALIILSSCADESTEETMTPITDQPGAITADDQILFMLPELPSIQRDEPSVLVPEATLASLDSIIRFMADNPDYILHITGFYSPSEIQLENYENLGMARADNLAGLLKERGADDNRIKLQSVMHDLVFDDNGGLLDGYRLVLRKIEPRVSGAYDKTVLFWAAERLMTYDPELKDYITNVTKHMNEQPGIKMVMTGHTDYNGNHLLGKMRAEALAEYFALYGLDTSRVIIRSEGPDKPVAPNDTQENKQKNRRVEITFE